MRNRFFNFWEREQLSVVELVNSGTLDLRLAGLLWLLMEQRASVIVCAGPNFAGKTTLLNVMLNFLPPEVSQITLEGNFEDFSFLDDSVPDNTYMVAEEFNTYMNYVWGDVARKSFELLGQGYHLGGTIHATAPEEAVYILHRYLGLPLPVISHLDVIVTLRVMWGRTYRSDLIREIDSVCLVMPEDDTMTLQQLAVHPQGEKNITIADEQTLQEAFSKKLNADYSSIGHEISKRGELLARLLIENRISHDEVRAMVRDFYRSRRTDV
jgi:energy-coupling factor transporter ATP-binding protein EcfA2